LTKPSPLNLLAGKLRTRLQRTFNLSSEGFWQDERRGCIGRLLRRLPEGTAILYHYVTPRIDPDLNLRRFLFQDITVRQAVDARAYGFDKLSDQECRAAADRQRQSVHEVDGVVTFSRFVAEALHADYGLPVSKVFAIGAGPIRRPFADVSTTLDRYRSRRVLFVGRAWERKGGPLLVEAFRLVKAELPDATLTIVSSGAPRINEPGITSIGFASNEQLQQLYASSSVFCMPSVCETWGLVYGEAMHAGLAVVGTNEWAMRDIVVDGVTGQLAPNRSPLALAKALVSSLRDPIVLQRMAIAGNTYAREVLDWPVVIDRLVSAMIPGVVVARDQSPPLGEIPAALTEPVDT
jgi:glycosyltransferase involved in cell wall biosynthesis